MCQWYYCSYRQEKSPHPALISKAQMLHGAQVYKATTRYDKYFYFYYFCSIVVTNTGCIGPIMFVSFLLSVI